MLYCRCLWRPVLYKYLNVCLSWLPSPVNWVCRCGRSISLISSDAFSVCSHSVDVNGTAALEYLTLYKFTNFPVLSAQIDTCNSK
jgi:hypothetical protein